MLHDASLPVLCLVGGLLGSWGAWPMSEADRDESAAPEPLRIVLVGLVHGHAEGLLWNAGRRDDIELVGVCEPNRSLFDEAAERHGLAGDLYWSDLATMLDAVRPEAASVQTSIADHAEVVERCAERGVHVLVEKPLAFSVADGERCAEAARRHGVLVLTNYETSWYPSVREARRLALEGGYGPIRRMVFRHGHPGPREIGCSEPFLAWLTDPDQNGGGALVDFGCYGIALATWLRGGERPTTIQATARTLKPDLYPHVDDDATIVLGYEGATAVVQASWAWTHDNKEVDLHGEGGSIHAGRGAQLAVRTPDGPLEPVEPEEPPAELNDEWTYLRHVVRGECAVDPLSSLELNLVVVEVLDAARAQVARHGD